jgi:selenide,water dikinase
MAQRGDALVLTKPVGSGLVLGANEFDPKSLKASDMTEALELMLRGNAAASQVARDCGVKSSTDVSGFGLLGSCLEIAKEANLSVMLDFDLVPVLSGVSRALAVGAVSPLAEILCLIAILRLLGRIFQLHRN